MVVTVSPALGKQLAQGHEGIDCKVIYNGFDIADFEAIPGDEPGERFLVAYVGNLKANQNPGCLWQAICELREEDAGFGGCFQLRFTGKMNPDVEYTLNRTGLESVTTVEDYVPHNEAILRMRRASVLLFIIPEAPDNLGILTGKLFDYLAAGRPLLSIGPLRGDAATLLSTTKAGPMYDYDDKEGIKRRLRTLYQWWLEGRLSQLRPDADRVKRYERRTQAEELANLMNSLVSRIHERQSL
jgi:hypothetical protein